MNSPHRFNTPRLAFLVEDLPTATAILNVDGVILEANVAMAELTGLPPTALPGLKLRDLSHPDDADTLPPDVVSMQAGERQSAVFERRLLVANAPVRWVRVAVSKRTVADQIFVFCTMEDRTEEKRLAVALEERELLYRTVVQNLPNAAVLVFDEEMRYTVAEGEALFAGVGLTQRELLGRTMQEVASPENVATVTQIYQWALEGERADFEAKREGRTYGIHAIPLQFHGRRHGMLMIYELTPLHAALQKAAEAQRRLSALIENSTDGMWSIDRNYRLTAFNRAFHDMFEMATGQDLALGDHFLDSQPLGAQEFWRPLLERGLAGQRFTVAREFVVHGERHVTQIAINPIVAPEGVQGLALFSSNLKALPPEPPPIPQP